jgi:hypothetical protein
MVDFKFIFETLYIHYMYKYFGSYMLIDVVVLQSWRASVYVCVTFTHKYLFGTLIHGRRIQTGNQLSDMNKVYSTTTICPNRFLL